MKEPKKATLVKTPVTVTINIIAIWVIGLLWLAYCLYLALSPNTFGVYLWIMVGTSFISGLVCLVLGALLRKKSKTIWTLSIIAFAIMLIVRVFDQIGWVDVAVMTVSAIPLVLLIIDRNWYLKAKA